MYVTEGSTDGPTLLVTGGVHGDEQSGYLSAGRIKDWDIDAGKLVVIPKACKPAIDAGSRQFSDGDLNRHFPHGSNEESALASAIWDVAVQENIDFLWDLHSSYGIYESGDGGVGQALFATDAGDAGVHSKAIRDYLNQEVLDDSLDSKYDFREHTHDNDGARDMLKHKVGASLDTPAIIFEATEKLSLDRQVKYTTAAVERFMYRFGLLETRLATEKTGGIRYDGDATAIDASVDSNGKRSGLTFGFTNDAGHELTITGLTIDPSNAAIDELSDHSYDEGRWTSELHIAADVQDGLTDVNGGLTLPGSIDLDADGHSDSADCNAIMSPGSSATVSLYQFESGGTPVDMVGESVDVTVDYRLPSGRAGSTSFTLSPPGLGYEGDAVAIDASVDTNGKRSGVQFGVTNDTAHELTITDLTIDPSNDAIDELSDHSYDEGLWTSELHIAADVQDGLTDVNHGLTLPGSIDLDADGHSDSADCNAIMSPGSSATVSLYQFESGGTAVDMSGETVTITIDYTLGDGSRGTRTLPLTL
ncbi:M14 family metallopeptidase [Haladaptatus caseinilyticus]|uniref:succinylglutamate desuccinylase/aspartoacylase domain-containing protein n=1 Tax=Haladaptatus caseinilyticus TaxID=2993314 RepID=UPI00224A9592|nr:succinylglutamate desuccinylase/aspartoacylase family protein [Haladaptatus caseinilyticus]